MQTQPYVYIVKHRLTGEFYVGSKYARGCTPENTPNYFGSPGGKSGRSARWAHVIKHERHYLEKRVIDVFDNKHDAIELEEFLHEEVIAHPLCRNGAKQTGANFSFAGAGRDNPNYGRKHTDAAKNRISKLNSGKEIPAVSKANRERVWTEEMRAKLKAAQAKRKALGIPGPNKGRTPSPEAVAKQAAALKANWALRKAKQLRGEN